MPPKVRVYCRMISYPEVSTVQAADRYQLGYWMRFLPSPGLNYIKANDSLDKFIEIADEEKAILNLIMARFESMGGWDNVLSKEVGWDMPK